jgi:ketosteroid isomerase-like protein
MSRMVDDVESEVLEAMDRLGARLWSRDLAIMDEFVDDVDVLLVGSEDGEIARGRAAIEALMRGLFDLPMRLTWDWRRRTVSHIGDIAWVFADCEVVLTFADGEKRKPYRMTGVLQRLAGRWRWRQFHGSEPAAAPTPTG